MEYVNKEVRLSADIGYKETNYVPEGGKININMTWEELQAELRRTLNKKGKSSKQ